MSATNTQENTTSAENNNSTNLTEDHTNSNDNDNLTNSNEAPENSNDNNQNYIKGSSNINIKNIQLNTSFMNFTLNGEVKSSFLITSSQEISELIKAIFAQPRR